MTGLDRSSPLPLYYQLKEALLAFFQQQGFTPGDRVPGDFELCEQYGVSRTVVRQALTELEYDGVIERIKGKGTFYATPKVGEGLAQSLTGLYEDVAARGGDLVSEVRRLEVVPADPRLAAELEIGPYQPVVVLERLRIVDGQPWALTITHVPFDLAPGLLEKDFSHESLYAVLEGEFGIRLARGHRSIEAALATKSVAELLGVATGSPLLVLRSVSRDEAGRPVESFVAFHRGDRSRFEVDLTRGPNGGAGAAPLVIVTDSSARGDAALV
ncbi:GntR family transcriptional regulator [Leifsonia sp. NPDC080035]|uniref:GntR family transcriptional regulator n=1 Tax=Leifsonia sp. NPDC080035 TaxID=3143936 RepID=A0AAU7GIZ1_9MICO